ncbi:uncharacterized protein KQ657_001534 [Scheffersomyces spartinae]|uniref:Uncharacterized protein n=1 Tax=Scheffersomyces spartinae TaxID=45513 RepID=A0A9P7V7N4_9ASCO|nr:uncharacterized protein KQ657_001534 [Scheffersomyces spartinae]KAG7192751.1 hypothetical protein KQ657_001534 [Scheffersomyces spartinae]
MFRRVQAQGRLAFKRFQSNSHGHGHGHAAGASEASSFTNKYNFNIDPPAVHEYWNARNASVLLAFIPAYMVVASVAKYVAENQEGWGGLHEYADAHFDKIYQHRFGEEPKQ